MRNILRFATFWYCAGLIILNSCEQEKQVPAPLTSEISEITGVSATSGGILVDEGSGRVTIKGVCWSKGTNPRTDDNKTSDGPGAGIYKSCITDLEAATTYYVRAYAVNNAGTGYGKVLSFTTLGAKPVTSILGASNITKTTATLTGSVNPNCLETKVFFEYGPTTDYGKSAGIFEKTVNGNLNYIVGADITGLEPGRKYHFRIKAENSLGIIYSQDTLFTTLGQAPSAITRSAINIMASGVRFRGTVIANLMSTDVKFEYGTTTNYGSLVVASESPVAGNTPIDVSFDLKGLVPNTTYHYRIVANNNIGVTYGGDVSFTTSSTITDIDGNIYGIITIGSQIWMQENLKTTRYNDNTAIPYVTSSPDPFVWDTLSSPGFCYYFDDPATYKDIYGAYYNWYAVDTRKICPVGWHVPSYDDWHVFETFLGGLQAVAAKITEVGTEHWVSPNALATNESGFTALPGGYRDISFIQESTTAVWISSSATTMGTTIWVRALYSGDYYMSETNSINNAYNIRCLKDN
jgi:uncharacterized protein (TIGR02145 family)